MTQPSTMERRPEVGGEGFNRKVAGLPTWGWIGIAGAAAVVLLLWLQNRGSSQQQSTQDTTGTTSVDQTGALETLTAQIRDLQGANSQPVGVTKDHGTYYFGIEGDTNPTTRYVGIPGVGYYGVPGIDVANQFLKARPGTIGLGQISQSEASTRFGPLLPWSSLGTGSTS